MIRSEAASGTRRIAFATSDASAFLALRRSLLVEAIRRRHAVALLAPSFEPDTRDALQSFGVDCQTIALAPQGYNPFAGFRLKRDLANMLRSLRLNALAVTDLAALPLLGSAARRAGVAHIVPMLEEFPESTSAEKLLRRAFDLSTGLVLATEVAARRAKRSGWLKASTRVDVMPSGGVDLVAMSARPLPPTQDGLTFLLITHATDRTAQQTFASAAEDVRRKVPTARFIAARDIFGTTVAAAHVIVHTSAVDGLPPGLLAGLATGRPLITSDVAGARETVDERVNGCRVAPGDAHALADAMLTFLRRPDQLAALARASRSKAERRFDARAIDNATLAALGLAESFAAAA